MSRSWTIRLFAIALIIVIVLAGFGNAVLYLWNGVMPAVFHLPAISYWQGVGLLALSWIFFGSWRAFPRLPTGQWDAARSTLNPGAREAIRAALGDAAQAEKVP